MPALLRLAAVTVLLLAALDGRAQAPRDAVVDIAHVIESRYYDAAKATKIATDLRNEASRGDFDRYADPRDLATALSNRLQPLDRHFRVDWSQAEAAPASAQDRPTMRRRNPGTGGPGAGATAAERRGNFGVRRVEVLPGNVGYIDLREFSNFAFGRADQPARRAIEAALQMVSATDAVIIDLRENGGGAPAMVGFLTSAFTPKDAKIYNVFHSRRGTHSEAPSDWYPTPRLEVPLYVLISGRTGSAAESFAYTMKNAGRATIVGEASGGAANPGGQLDAGHGFRIFVSSGSPISPITGTNWEGSGVAPDISATPEMALEVARKSALKAILDQGLPEPEATDTKWALEALHAESSPARIEAAPYVGRYGAFTVAERDGALTLQRDRRPALILVPLAKDTFSVAGDPSRRVIFERDDGGTAIALELRLSNGQGSRYLR